MNYKPKTKQVEPLYCFTYVDNNLKQHSFTSVKSKVKDHVKLLSNNPFIREFSVKPKGETNASTELR